MNKQSFVKIFAVVFIIILLLLACHSFLHGLERNEEHCLLCDLLATGFSTIESFRLLLLFLLIAVMSQRKYLPFRSSTFLQIKLRAPPYQPNL